MALVPSCLQASTTYLICGKHLSRVLQILSHYNDRRTLGGRCFTERTLSDCLLWSVSGSPWAQIWYWSRICKPAEKALRVEKHRWPIAEVRSALPYRKPQICLWLDAYPAQRITHKLSRCLWNSDWQGVPLGKEMSKPQTKSCPMLPEDSFSSLNIMFLG